MPTIRHQNELPCALLCLLLSSTASAQTTLDQRPSNPTTPALFNTEQGTNGPSAGSGHGPMPVSTVLAQTKLPPGFHLTAFAAEPDVHQPIAMATDARGRLWVAENYSYS